MGLKRITALRRDLIDHLSGAVPTSAAALAEQLPSTRKLRDLAIDGHLPAVQVNSIWHYRDTDRDAIAAALGVPVPSRSAVSA